ncbi:hypothetical protein GPECTOR_1g527 [Gonium pectorale]|uniref:Uncharacterized protein n=1 Tax=Gonium pectorale TaxID=33097 RepID=A0A150H337_GONPE|nr:hypothetical protein GPECTOR_1g527 [Gonium pectorale]|eukprot:KXZ56586.1 hypothetical protein GPECTOR_1g527 [Gonium pectorale]
MSTETAQAAVPTAPAAVTAEPASPEAAAGEAKLPKSASKKEKIVTEPHGYIADKFATFTRAVKTLTKKLKLRTKEKEKAATAGSGAQAAPQAAGVEPSPEAAAPPQPATPEAGAVAGEAPAAKAGPVASIIGQLHHHEPADKLHEPLSTADKVKNAVVSTVEHVVDEAAAVQSSIAQAGHAVAEELGKFTHEAHEAQQHPGQPPAVTTTGGLPLAEK